MKTENNLSSDHLPSSLSTSIDITAQSAETDIGATITAALARADEFLKSLDALAALLPRMEAPHPLTVDFVRGHASVPLAFLYTALAAVEQRPMLQQLGKFDITSARATLQLIEAFRPVLDRLFAFAEKVRFTLDSRRSTLAADSLQAYAILKGMARDAGGADDVVVVANLKRDLNRKPSKEIRQKQATLKVVRRYEKAKAYIAAHAKEVSS
jgi:hypothetical protein